MFTKDGNEDDDGVTNHEHNNNNNNYYNRIGPNHILSIRFYVVFSIKNFHVDDTIYYTKGK